MNNNLPMHSTRHFRIRQKQNSSLEKRSLFTSCASSSSRAFQTINLTLLVAVQHTRLVSGFPLAVFLPRSVSWLLPLLEPDYLIFYFGRRRHHARSDDRGCVSLVDEEGKSRTFNIEHSTSNVQCGYRYLGKSLYPRETSIRNLVTSGMRGDRDG